MNKLLLTVFISALVLSFVGFVGQAEASILLTDTTTFSSSGTTPIEDYDGHNKLWGKNVQWLRGIGDYVAWTHHFTYASPVDQILNAELFISLYDDEKDTNIFKKEIGVGWGEDFKWDFGEVDPGVYNYTLKGQYLLDGTYSVKLASLGGDFGISQSVLNIEYTPSQQEVVPEPATMVLFSTGLLGGFFRKKFFG